jgi:hypothetical protein
MIVNSHIRLDINLSAVLIKKNGERIDLGDLDKKKSWLRRFLDWSAFDQRGLVTTVAVNYIITDMASGTATPDIGAFTFHDSGTGTTAAAIGDTALQTPWGGARVSGTHTSSTNVYTSVATIAFNNTFAITEWGLFSAASVGTLLDHRVFAAINVANGDSIQFTYNLTMPAGGS